MRSQPLLFSLLGLMLLFSSPSWAELAGSSIYHLNSEWKNQNNQTVALSDFKGKKVVLSMAYTTCQHTCPTIVSNMQVLESALSPEQKEKVVFVLVSLSPEVDTPAVLKAYESKRGLQNWSLLSGSKEDVRALAMAINVRYKSVANGEVSHSNLINIISPGGVLEYAVSGVGNTSVEAIRYLQQP